MNLLETTEPLYHQRGILRGALPVPSIIRAPNRRLETAGEVASGGQD